MPHGMTSILGASKATAQPKHCNQCNKECARKCAKCKQAFYCSDICQKSDWKKHMKHCPTLELIAPDDKAIWLLSIMEKSLRHSPFSSFNLVKLDRSLSSCVMGFRVMNNVRVNSDCTYKNKMPCWSSWNWNTLLLASRPFQRENVWPSTKRRGKSLTRHEVLGWPSVHLSRSMIY